METEKTWEVINCLEDENTRLKSILRKIKMDYNLNPKLRKRIDEINLISHTA